MQHTTSVIRIENLSKTYPAALVPALDGLSLDVGQAEIFGLLGPNGAGKTTTINVLCGLLVADAGCATVLEMDTNIQKDSIRKRIGVVPQNIALYPNLSGQENIAFIGRLYGIDAITLKQKAAILLEQFGLTPHTHKRVNRYSGGMKRRLNIIASLLHDPEILILDEPTAGVDVQSRALILNFLKQYRALGKTIVYTSHLLEEAEQICDRIAIVDEGKVMLQGVPKQLIQNTPDCKRLEDVFLHYTGRSLRD